MSDPLIKGAKKYKKEVLKMDSEKVSKRKRHKLARLFDYIPKQKMIALFENAMDIIEVDNNVKADRIVEIMGPEFQELGTGTNRIALMRDHYVFKIALDRRGMIDNLAEYKRSAEVPVYLAKCYETNRVVAISEYVNVLQQNEFSENKDKLRTILKYLTNEYVVMDLGLTLKNYCNWGYRDDGSIVALDYAYMYPLKGNEKALCCSCGGSIHIDGSFTSYVCNKCGLRYAPMEILNKMNLDAERIDDAAIFKEAEVDIENAEIKFGDEFVNYVKMKSYDEKDKHDDEDDDDIKNISSVPLNTSSLAEAMKSYDKLNEVDDDFDTGLVIDKESDADQVYVDEFLSALNAFERKKSENDV